MDRNKSFEKIFDGIDEVSTMLDIICHTTGMRFAAVARVTDTQWITCAARDDIDFGLKPGDELALQTTLCDEIRSSHLPIVIDHVDMDRIFSKHHTPSRYGFQSYISVPIILENGIFFGTLCAIDPEPMVIKGTYIEKMFILFARIIAQHLEKLKWI